MADVFISYKSESAELARKIADALEKSGVSCWYANRDAAPGPYPGQIKRAIDACRVFLLLLERAALHSEHVKNETALAFRRLARHEPITLLPFRLDDCNVQEDDDLDYYLIRQQIVGGDIQGLTARICKIVKQ